MTAKGEDVKSYTKPVSLFIRDYLWKEYPGGIVAIGFENGKSHSCIRTGDIVVMVNGKTLTCTEAFSALRKEYGKTTPVKVLRLSDAGILQEIMLTFREEDPRVQYLDLMESTN